jgi:hypothetical protein
MVMHSIVVYNCDGKYCRSGALVPPVSLSRSDSLRAGKADGTLSQASKLIQPSLRHRQVTRWHNLSFVHSLMTTLIAWWKPVVIYLSRRASSIWEQSKDTLAFPKMARQIRTTGEQSYLAISIAELALKPLGLMRVVLVPLQIPSARALVGADVTREHLPL